MIAVEIDRLKQSPVTHGAIGIEANRFLERALGFVEPKAMKQREPLVEPPLGLRRFRGDRDMGLADALDLLRRRKFGEVDSLSLRGTVLVRLGRGDQTDEQ